MIGARGGMRAWVALCGVLAACGNYGNVYLPEGRRKPDLGPEPADFGPSATLERKAGAFRFRLYAPPGVPLQLTLECSGPAGVSLAVWVNARRLPPGPCPYQGSIPEGTILAGTAAVIEVEPSEEITLHRARVSPENVPLERR